MVTVSKIRDMIVNKDYTSLLKILDGCNVEINFRDVNSDNFVSLEDFNNSQKYYDVYKNHRGCYSSIFGTRHNKKDIYTLMIVIYLAYNMNIDRRFFLVYEDIKVCKILTNIDDYSDISSHNIKFLSEYHCLEERKEYCFVSYLLKTNGNIDEYSKDINSLIRSKNEELIEYMLIFIEDFDMQIDFDRYLLYYVSNKQLVDKILDRLNLNLKLNYNSTHLLHCLFFNNENLDALIERCSNVSSDKISLELIDKFNKGNYIPFNRFIKISHLENFNDFVENNYFLLSKILDEESIRYIRNI